MSLLWRAEQLAAHSGLRDASSERRENRRGRTIDHLAKGVARLETSREMNPIVRGSRVARGGHSRFV